MADITVTAAQVAAIYPEKAEIVTMIAAEAITAGQAVRQNTAGKAELADANAAGEAQFRGIALTAGAAGEAISVLKKGHVYGFTVSGLDCDAALFLSDTTGSLADAASITVSVNAGRVVAMPDAGATKVAYIEADWLRTWS